MPITKRHINKILISALWLVLGGATLTLLIAAISKKKSDICRDVSIHISGVQSHFFIDKSDVIDILESTNKGKIQKGVMSEIDLASMEKALQKNKWIKNAELYFDNNNILQVMINEREPVARIFTTTGASFYIDSSLKRLPLSDKYSPRLAVFTSFPTDVIVLTKEDSLLLKAIRNVGVFIAGHDFWMAQIEQTDISDEREFVMIPKIGSQLIYFGDGRDYQNKFGNLMAYYRKVAPSVGWNTYASLSVKYRGQVVGVRRDAREIKADSLRTIQIMKAIIAKAKESTNDTTRVQLSQPADNITIVNTPHEVEEVPVETVPERSTPAPTRGIPPLSAPEISPETTKPINIDNQQSFKKPVLTPSKKVQGHTQQKTKQEEPPSPKALMPAKGDL